MEPSLRESSPWHCDGAESALSGAGSLSPPHRIAKTAAEMSTHKAKWLVLLANATAAAALRPGAPHARALFCLGGPGAGKGTQCARLEHEFGWAHVSAGELLRAARAGGSEESRVIADCLDRGAIVPVAVTLRLLRRAIDEATRRGAPVVVVDGFPRNADNVEGWEADAATKGLDVRGVLFYDVPHDVLLQRIAVRGASGERDDDDAETARRRIRVYEERRGPSWMRVRARRAA